MAREAPEDPYAGLAPGDRLLTRRRCPISTPTTARDPAPAALKARALAIEEAARGVAGITNSARAPAPAPGARRRARHQPRLLPRLHDQLLWRLGERDRRHGGGMQRDYAYHSVRHYADLDAPEAIGRAAGERAVARLDPAKLASGRDAGRVRSARRRAA